MSGPRSGIREVLGRASVHPFPARMAPGIAFKALSELKEGARVLDPMAGSGTVLAMARAEGFNSIGVDVDPLAVLMASVWTRAVRSEDCLLAANRAMSNARKRYQSVAISNAYPRNADKETRAFIRYWFDPQARRQLTALIWAIDQTQKLDVRNVLYCAFSRMICAKQAGVSLAMDLSHSRPHRAFKRGPRRPFDCFEGMVARVVEGCVAKRMVDRGPEPVIKLGDARKLPVKTRSVDLVLTSPPYLNAIDYLRASKFSLVWFGYSISEIRDVRSRSIGAEVAGPASSEIAACIRAMRIGRSANRRVVGIVRRYISDTGLALDEVARVLKTGGKAVFVVGENTLRGTYVPTGRLLVHLARPRGLRLEKRGTRGIPASRRYMPPPSIGKNGMNLRMRREVILTFRRVSGTLPRAKAS